MGLFADIKTLTRRIEKLEEQKIWKTIYILSSRELFLIYLKYNLNNKKYMINKN